MQDASPPGPLPPPPPQPVQGPPGWQSAIVTVMRILFGMWVLFLCWIGAFFTMMSDGCGQGCPAYERQLLIGWGVSILLLCILFGVSFPIVRRIGNFGGKVALLVIFAIVAPGIPLLIGSILSGLAP